MEDSFEARLTGQTPVAPEKKKSGKGWMICSIVTLVLLIGVGVFAGILFFNKDDSKVSDLEKKVDEKNARIAELEEKQSEPTETECDTSNEPTETSTNTTPSDTININFDSLKSAAKQAEGLKDFTDITLQMTENGKYVVAGGNAVEDAEAGGYYLYMYKENKSGSSWKKILATQSEMGCDQFSQQQKEVLHGLVNCVDSDGYTTNL